MPPSGSISPAAIFSSVDLPEPLRPTSAILSPGSDATARRPRAAGSSRGSAGCLEGEDGGGGHGARHRPRGGAQDQSATCRGPASMPRPSTRPAPPRAKTMRLSMLASRSPGCRCGHEPQRGGEVEE